MTLQQKSPLKRKAPMRATGIAKEVKVRMKKCALKSCRTPFPPRSMSHVCCSVPCSIAHVEAQKVAKLRKERQAGLKALKTRQDWLREAQAALNSWVRLVRDAGKPCISCGRHHQGQNHGGHYLSRGAHPNLALVELNVHLQCSPCNVHLSGNQINFRRGLIARYGVDLVEMLESDQNPRKYTIEQLKEKKEHYQRLVRENRKEQP